MLVPIRLDMEIEGQKLRDTFTWNKNGIIYLINLITNSNHIIKYMLKSLINIIFYMI